MPTPAQIDEQIAHEREAIRCGIDKLYKDTQKLSEREYASATVYGVSSITAAQEVVAKAILDTFKNRIARGKNGQAFADIMSHLSQFNDEKQVHILANIALKAVELDFLHVRHSTEKSKPRRIPALSGAEQLLK